MAIDLYSVPPAPDHVRDAYFADFANRDPLPLTLDLVERLFYLMPHHFGLELDFAIAQRQPLSEAGVLVHRAIRQNDNWLRIVVGLGSRLSLTDVLTMPSDELTMAAAHIIANTIDAHGLDTLIEFMRPKVRPFSVKLRELGA